MTDELTRLKMSAAADFQVMGLSQGQINHKGQWHSTHRGTNQ